MGLLLGGGLAQPSPHPSEIQDAFLERVRVYHDEKGNYIRYD
jgi:hypothetical protein